jgi:hypothetical protein
MASAVWHAVQRTHRQDAECLRYEDQRQAEDHYQKLRKRRPITHAELDRTREYMEKSAVLRQAGPGTAGHGEGPTAKAAGKAGEKGRARTFARQVDLDYTVPMIGPRARKEGDS